MDRADLNIGTMGIHRCRASWLAQFDRAHRLVNLILMPAILALALRAISVGRWGLNRWGTSLRRRHLSAREQGRVGQVPLWLLE